MEELSSVIGNCSFSIRPNQLPCPVENDIGLRSTFSIFIIFIFTSGMCRGQYKWDWHDPLDLNIFDFGDNKLLLYNAIGLGLTLKLTDQSPRDKKMLQPVVFSSYVDVMYEYSRPPKSDVLIGRFRWGKFLRQHLTVGADLSFYKVNDSEVSTFGIGGQVFFTWYLLKRDNWSLFFDNGVGPNFFESPFPYGGTRFNFTTFYGLYTAVRLPGIAWLTIGIKNIHISNAGIKGKERNPALDALGLSVGYQF